MNWDIIRRLGYDENDPRSRYMLTAQELGMGFVDLGRIKPDRTALEAIDKEIAIKHRIVPLKTEGQHIWVAVSEQRQDLGQLGETTGLKIIQVLASPEELRKALDAGHWWTK